MKTLQQVIENQKRSAANLRAHIDEQWQREQRMLLSKIQQPAVKKLLFAPTIDMDKYNPQRYYDNKALAKECTKALLNKLV